MLRKQGVKYNMGCAVKGVADVIDTPSIHLLSTSISIDYVIDITIPLSSGSIDTASLADVANATSKSLSSGLSNGDFNTQWQTQLLEYNVQDTSLFSATSFSVESTVEVIITTTSPTFAPSNTPTKSPHVKSESSVPLNRGYFIAIWVIISLFVVLILFCLLYWYNFSPRHNIAPYKEVSEMGKEGFVITPNKIHEDKIDPLDATENENDLRKMSIMPDDIIGMNHGAMHGLGSSSAIHILPTGPSFMNQLKNPNNKTLASNSNVAMRNSSEFGTGPAKDVGDNDSINSQRSNGSSVSHRDKPVETSRQSKVFVYGDMSDTDLNGIPSSKIVRKPTNNISHDNTNIIVASGNDVYDL
jgi:hypothetical protein